jgi:hypothetical protein
MGFNSGFKGLSVLKKKKKNLHPTEKRSPNLQAGNLVTIPAALPGSCLSPIPNSIQIHYVIKHKERRNAGIPREMFQFRQMSKHIEHLKSNELKVKRKVTALKTWLITYESDRN